MAQRKLQQDIDKCFKKVTEGIAAFEGIYDKILLSTNAAQKEKLEDALKREIKKLQRSRDQIKTWATGNDIKDKKPLLEQRKNIETQMEKFKAVEKEMKTKAYSKGGLAAAARLDPKEKEKLEACQFLSNQVEELERQIETMEAESESLQANMKRGKKDVAKAERVEEIERITERHKWHQGKLELMLRSLENGGIETEQVTDLEESIKYYVDDNQSVDFMEDDTIYDDLNLEDEEGAFGMNNENDHVSSQDTQSIQDETPEPESRGTTAAGGKTKPSSVSEPPVPIARRPSTQSKSPLPTFSLLHMPISSLTNGSSAPAMKPAPIPTRPGGETLKYASAAAAAAASDKNNLGIAPLPPPPGLSGISSSVHPNLVGLASFGSNRPSSNNSPNIAHSLPITLAQPPAQRSANPTPSNPSAPSVPAQPSPKSFPSLQGMEGNYASAPTMPRSANISNLLPKVPLPASASDIPAGQHSSHPAQEFPVVPVISAPGNTIPSVTLHTNGNLPSGASDKQETDESVYHLPPGLQDLIQSFEATKSRIFQVPTTSSLRHIAASHANMPGFADSDKPRHYKPTTRFDSPDYYPQEPLPLFDDPRLYSRVDTDTLFYIFYYCQGTYQQYLAAKALKSQSWRFHKRYQTWFQRHEEPKTITEEYEQGTYRFFDYESTWQVNPVPFCAIFF
ncbi:MAG: general negative regulator of transcription subunit 5 [Trizodia sp. TS-e1964]|nr:MAG: general negative regulator of transcription subunit 5 [Trizodia sp. TS-e1964]